MDETSRCMESKLNDRITDKLIPVVHVSFSSRDHPNIKFKLFLFHANVIILHDFYEKKYNK